MIELPFVLFMHIFFQSYRLSFQINHQFVLRSYDIHHLVLFCFFQFQYQHAQFYLVLNLMFLNYLRYLEQHCLLSFYQEVLYDLYEQHSHKYSQHREAQSHFSNKVLQNCCEAGTFEAFNFHRKLCTIKDTYKNYPFLIVKIQYNQHDLIVIEQMLQLVIPVLACLYRDQEYKEVAFLLYGLTFDLIFQCYNYEMIKGFRMYMIIREYRILKIKQLSMMLKQINISINKLSLQLIQMEYDIDDIFQFCAYYQINQYASDIRIHLTKPNIQKTIQEQKKIEKNNRKKIQIVEHKRPQKQIKRKIQVVNKKIQPQQKYIQRQQNPKTIKNLDYFINHINGFPQNSNQKSYEDYKKSKDKTTNIWRQNSMKNYQTFGQVNKNISYQKYSPRVEKQTIFNQGNTTQRPYQSSNNLLKSKLSQKNNYLPNYPSSIKRQFWQNSVKDERRNNKIDLQNLIYSPIKRQSLSPLQTSIISQIRQQQQKSLSKSSSKLKKKNSQRPLYNPTHLSIKSKQNQSNIKKNQYPQPMLSNSFISEDIRISNKKVFQDEERRQISAIYANKNIKDKTSLTRDSQVQLDDAIGQIISGIAPEQRTAPIQIALIGKTSKC